jgi:hypothetical protein
MPGLHRWHNFGRFVAQQRSGAAIRTLMAATPLSPGGGNALSRFGDAFGWACVLALASILFLLGASGRRLFGRPGPIKVQWPLRS